MRFAFSLLKVKKVRAVKDHREGEIPCTLLGFYGRILLFLPSELGLHAVSARVQETPTLQNLVLRVNS